MKLTVIGTGYVGIVSAVVFANFGNEVWGLDVDKKRIDILKKGKLHIFEPDLEKYLKKGLKSGRLHFTTFYDVALRDVDVILICVGTPSKLDGDYNLSYIFSAAKSIGRNLQNYAVIAIKSTVPPGTSAEVKKRIQDLTDIPFDLASCPEFLREGSAIYDSLHPARVVIGTETQKARKILLDLHQPIKAPRIVCDILSAQMIKYAANAFLATKISFINAIAVICDKIGADVKTVSEGLGLDERIGKSFLNPGLGYGGSCFPKDISALIHFAKRVNYDFSFLREIEKINTKQVDYFLEKLELVVVEKTLMRKRVAVLGLSFKPNTDDIRESRSIYLLRRLLQKGAKVQVYDPIALKNAKKIFGRKIDLRKDAYDAVRGSDVVFIATAWNEFKKLHLKKVARLMQGDILVDGRNIFDPEIVRKAGLNYMGVGRG